MSAETEVQGNLPKVILNTGRASDSVHEELESLRGIMGEGNVAYMHKPGYDTVEDVGWSDAGFKGARAMERAVRLLAKKLGLETWNDGAKKFIEVAEETLAHLRELGLAIVMVDDDASARTIFSHIYEREGQPKNHAVFACHCEALEGTNAQSGFEVESDGRIFVEIEGRRLQVAAIVLDCTLSCSGQCGNSNSVDFVEELVSRAQSGSAAQ